MALAVGSEMVSDAEKLTAAIFNKLNGGPNTDPVYSYDDLEFEAAPPEALKEWKAIEKAVSKLPDNVVSALGDMLKEFEAAELRGFAHGLVRAARIAKQRGNVQMARDLLLSEAITSVAKLDKTGADGDDIIECRSLFEGWEPTQADIYAAHRRTMPSFMQSKFNPEHA